jgi:predicted polyphosphate/ATP-dependent NAD kinase
VILGLVINPYAGMGGSVALKGTDGDALVEAIARGAMPKAGNRALEALRQVVGIEKLELLTAGGIMGAELLDQLGVKYRIVHVPVAQSRAEDTIRTVGRFCELNADLIVFCGGDGTAADVMKGMTRDVPVIGIPSGVKMHSAVFANDPVAAARLIEMFLKGGMPLKQGEVMDIDEDAFRTGVLHAQLVGHLTTLDDSALVQPAKGTIALSSDADEKEELGEYVASLLEKDVLYIIGPGTTCQSVVHVLGSEKTLLGVDLFLNNTLVGKDVTEEHILTTMDGPDRVKVIVTPIGRQGFIFGRGNQQISSRVLRRVGKENIMMIATPSKLRGLAVLKIDTGDATLDEELKGYVRVVVGFARERVMRIV